MLGNKEALPKVSLRLPLFCVCLPLPLPGPLPGGPLLCLQHVCALWARLCALSPGPAYHPTPCFFVLAFVSRQQRRGAECVLLSSLPSRHPSVNRPFPDAPHLLPSPPSRPSRCCSPPATHGSCQRKAQTSSSHLPHPPCPPRHPTSAFSLHGQSQTSPTEDFTRTLTREGSRSPHPQIGGTPTLIGVSS